MRRRAGLATGGRCLYFGKLVPKPYIGDEIRPIEPQDIRRSTACVGSGGNHGTSGTGDAGRDFVLIREF